MPLGNQAGGVVQPHVGTVLQDHKQRIRALEANASGGGVDSDWIDVDTLLNSYLDNSLVNPTRSDPHISYLKTREGLVLLRGRPIAGAEGKAAFQLPSAYAPPHDMWFATDVSCGGTGDVNDDDKLAVPSTVGHVCVRANGYVIPYANPTGYGCLNSAQVLDDFTGVAGTLLPSMGYYQPGTTYKIIVGDGLGLNAGPATPADALVFTGSDRYADSEVWATVTADCSQIRLGCRVQYPVVSQYSSHASTQTYMPGFWVNMPAAAGGTVTLAIQELYGGYNPINYSPVAPPPFTFTSPGFGAGDTIRLEVINNVMALYVGAPASGAPLIAVEFFNHHYSAWASGLFGIGATGTLGVPLVSEWGGGMPRDNTTPGAYTVGSALSGVVYKAA